MPLTLPPGTFHAYLFDCDGTITDSMPLHFLAWQKALAESNCVFTENLFYEWAGRPVAAIVADLNQQQGLNMPVEETTNRKEALFLENIGQLQPIPEVLEHIRLTHGHVPFAVVSGSPRESVIRSLEVLGIADLFDTFVCAGEYTRGKPDPEPFLIAAQRLNVAPEHCLVFEDADLGIQAATAAGMASIKIPTPIRKSA